MSAPSRRVEIRRRRTRKAKIEKLRHQCAKAPADADRSKFYEKARALSPLLQPNEFAKEAVSG